MKISKEAAEICMDYGHSLMLTDREILDAISDMTEEDFCKGAMYEVLASARQKVSNKWQRKDLREEY